MSKETQITKFFPSTRPANVERASVDSGPTVTATRSPEFNEEERAQYDSIVSSMRFQEESDGEDDIDDMEVVEEGTVAPPVPIPITVRCPDQKIFLYLKLISRYLRLLSLARKTILRRPFPKAVFALKEPRLQPRLQLVRREGSQALTPLIRAPWSRRRRKRRQFFIILAK
jgi:hypothetical protein